MGMHFSFKNKETDWSQIKVGIKEYMPSMLLKRKESKEEMVGAVYPGSRTIIEVVVSTRVIKS